MRAFDGCSESSCAFSRLLPAYSTRSTFVQCHAHFSFVEVAFVRIERMVAYLVGSMRHQSSLKNEVTITTMSKAPANISSTSVRHHHGGGRRRYPPPSSILYAQKKRASVCSHSPIIPARWRGQPAMFSETYDNPDELTPTYRVSRLSHQRGAKLILGCRRPAIWRS